MHSINFTMVFIFLNLSGSAKGPRGGGQGPDEEGHNNAR